VAYTLDRWTGGGDDIITDRTIVGPNIVGTKVQEMTEHGDATTQERRQHDLEPDGVYDKEGIVRTSGGCEFVGDHLNLEGPQRLAEEETRHILRAIRVAKQIMLDKTCGINENDDIITALPLVQTAVTGSAGQEEALAGVADDLYTSTSGQRDHRDGGDLRHEEEPDQASRDSVGTHLINS
jgi:hypothetical protein